jgi:hypothetical protein
MRNAFRWTVLPLVALAAACGAGKKHTGTPPADAAGAGHAAGNDSASGMQRMPGMQGQQSDAGAAVMQAQMRAMHGASADSLARMLPVHRRMAASMIAEMNRQMRQTNMQPDAVWTATVDSLRQDLVRMPEMGASELRSFMPAHQARMARLVDMHRRMMGGMKM